jgi:hypothetical protein
MKWPDGLNPHQTKAIELQASSTVYTSVRPPAAGGMPSFAETLQQTGDVVTRALKTSPNKPDGKSGISRVSFLWSNVGWGRSSPRRGKIHQFKLKTQIYWALLGPSWKLLGHGRCFCLLPHHLHDPFCVHMI